MTTYGFRLFAVELRRERGRKNIDFCQQRDGSTWRYRDYAHALIESHCGQREWADPHDQSQVLNDDGEAFDAEDPARRPIFAVEDVSRLGVHTVFSVRYGRQSGHDKALPDPDDLNGVDIDIEKHTPSRIYRATLLLPEDGEQGLLAVETVGRTCPRQPIIRWLSQWSYTLSTRKEPNSSPGISEPWWKLMARPLGDKPHLDRFIQEARARSLTLVTESVSADNKRYSEAAKLTFELKHEITRRAMSGLVSGWNRIIKNQRSVDPQEAARQVAQDMGGDAMASMGFEDVIVTMSSEKYGEKRIRASDFADEVFIYRLSEDSPPSEQQFYSAVRAAAQRVGWYGGALDWEGWPPGRL